MTGIEKRGCHSDRSQEKGAHFTTGGHTGKHQGQQEAEGARRKLGPEPLLWFPWGETGEAE